MAGMNGTLGSPHRTYFDLEGHLLGGDRPLLGLGLCDFTNQLQFDEGKKFKREKSVMKKSRDSVHPKDLLNARC